MFQFLKNVYNQTSFDYDKETQSFDINFLGQKKKLKQIQDQNLDRSKDIWIGKRPLKILGSIISIYGAEHWAVMIDGVNYSLSTDNGGADGTIVIDQTEDKKYNWYYYGPNYKSYVQIKNYVQDINQQKIHYTILNNNCQKYSLKIAQFANNNQKNINEDVFMQAIPSVASGLATALPLIGSAVPIISGIFDVGKSVISTIGSMTSSKPDTIGQMKNDISTVGQMKNSSGYRGSGSRSGNSFVSMDDYYNQFEQRNSRAQQYNNLNYGPQSYSQPTFQFSQNANNGFQNSNQYGQITSTIRKSVFNHPTSDHHGNDFQKHFQGINYDLPKQNLHSLQPFASNKIQQQQLLNNYTKQFNTTEIPRPQKKVQLQSSYQQPALEPPQQLYNTNNYEKNDYTTGQFEEEDEYDE